MIGAILGDIIGSRFEFANHLSKEFTLITRGSMFTDDTVMSCAAAQAILDCGGDYSDLPEKAVAAMQRIGREYPYCGYGSRFIFWVFSDDPQPYNSCGNGSAMRISAAGFAAESIEQAKLLAKGLTEITHNHPEGMKGAEATAVAIVMARQGATKEQIRDCMANDYGYDIDITVDEYRKWWGGHGKEVCQISVPQALVCFLEGNSYEDVIRNCISIGGDSDTIAAIAGGIAEAYYGVPERLAKLAMKKLDARLRGIVEEFGAKYPNNIIPAEKAE